MNGRLYKEVTILCGPGRLVYCNGHSSGHIEDREVYFFCPKMTPQGQLEALGRTHIGARERGRPRRGEPPRERTELGGNPQSIVSYSMRESPFNSHNATWRVSWQVSY